MVKLTKAQREVLQAMSDGDQLYFNRWQLRWYKRSSREMGDILNVHAKIAESIKNNHLIVQGRYEDGRQFYVLTDAGRSALEAQS